MKQTNHWQEEYSTRSQHTDWSGGGMFTAYSTVRLLFNTCKHLRQEEYSTRSQHIDWSRDGNWPKQKNCTSGKAMKTWPVRETWRYALSPPPCLSQLLKFGKLRWKSVQFGAFLSQKPKVNNINKAELFFCIMSGGFFSSGNYCCAHKMVAFFSQNPVQSKQNRVFFPAFYGVCRFCLKRK